MNKIFKVIWNHSLNQFVVTSELGKSHNKAASGSAEATDKRLPLNKIMQGMLVAGLVAAVPNLAEAATAAQATLAGDGKTIHGNGVPVLIHTHSEGGVAIGKNVTASDGSAGLPNSGGVAIGTNAHAQSQEAVAIGQNVSGGGVAIGRNIESAGFSFGYNITNSGLGAFAMGTNVSVSKAFGIAIGGSSRVDGVGAMAIGQGSKATGLDAIAIGGSSESTLASSLALGKSAKANRVNSVAIGANSETDSAANMVDNYTIGEVTYNKGYSRLARGTVSFGNKSDGRPTVMQLQYVALGLVSADSTDAVNGSQLYAVAEHAAKPITFKGNDGEKGVVLGKTLNIIGASTKAAGIAEDTLSAPTSGSYSSGNIQTVVTDDRVQIQIADNPSFHSVKARDHFQVDNVKITREGVVAGSNTFGINGIAIGTAGGTSALSINNTGQLTAGTNRFDKNGLVIGGMTFSNVDGVNLGGAQLFGLRDGAAGDHAVTVNQLNANITNLRNELQGGGAVASQNLYTQANGVNAQQIDKTNRHANFIDGKNIKVTGDAGGIKISTADDITIQNLTAANTVSASIFNSGSNSFSNAGLVVGSGANTISISSSGDLVAGGNRFNQNGLTIGGISITNNNGMDLGGKKITNIAEGAINASSTDAVRGSQIHDLEQRLRGVAGTAAADAANRKSYFHVNTGSNAGGDTTTNEGFIDQAAGATGANALAAGVNAIASEESAVAIGYKALANHSNSVALGQGSTTAEATRIANEDVGALTVGYGLDNLTYQRLDNPIGVVSIGHRNPSGGINANGYSTRQIVGVANGMVAKHSTHAVNGSQLYSAVMLTSNVGGTTASHFGGGSTMDKFGRLSAPQYNIGGLQFNNVGDALKDLDDHAIRNLTTQADGRDAQALTKTNNKANFLSGKNIALSGAAGGITIATKDDLEVTSLKAGTNVFNTTGLTVGGVSISNTGINAGGKNISGVATATQDDQAVNFGQLKGLQASLLAGDTSASVVTHNGLEVSSTPKGNITEYKVGLDANTLANVTAGGNALQNIITQADGRDAQTLNKANNKANFKAGQNIKLTGAADGITIATAENLTGNSFTAGTVVLNTNGIQLGNKQITGLAAGTADDHAVNLGQLSANVTALNQAINANKVTVEKGNENVTVSAQTTASGTVYKISAKDTTATVSAAAGGALTVNPGTENNGVKNFEIDLSANSKTALTAAGTALQSFHTQANGVNAQQVDKNNAKANFTNGKNITLTGSASGIDIALKDAIDVTSVTAGGNVFNNTGLTVGGVKIEANGINAGGKNISGVATATQDDQAVNFGQLKGLQAALTAGDTSASVVTHNGLEVSSSLKGNITEYKVGLDAASLNKLAAADSALQGLTTQVDGRDAQAINKTNNKANFKTGSNIVLTGGTDGITIATKDDLVATSFKAGNVVFNAGGIQLGGKQITGLADGTANDHAVNLGQLSANITTLNNSIKDNQVKVVNGNANVSVVEEVNPTGGKIYKVSANDTSAKVSNGQGITVQTVGAATNGVTEYKVELDAATIASLGKADNALQGFKTRVNGADAQSIDKNNPNADFTAGDNIVLTGSAGGIKIATAPNLNVQTVTANTFTAGTNVFNAGGLTVGGVKIEAGGIDLGNKNINNVASATQDHQAVNYGQLKGLQAALTAGDTSASVSAQDGITVVSVNKTGTVTDYKVGLTAEVRNNLTAASSALQGIVTQADGRDAQTLDKTNNKANFKAGANIKLTPATDGITIATAEDLIATSFKAGNVVINAGGITLGGKQISGVGDATAADQAVNLGQLTANLTTINNSIKDNQVKVVNGNANVSVVEEANPTGGKIYKVSAIDTNAKVTNGQGITVQTVGTPTNGVTEYKVELDAATIASLGKADSALQGFKTRVNGADAQTIDKNNPNADFTAGDNIVLTGTASGIKVATSRNLDVDKITAGTNVFNSTGITIGGVSITNTNGIDMGGKQISNVGDAVNNDQAVNYGQLKDAVSTLSNNLGNSKWNLASSGNAAANEINPDDKVVFEGVGSLNVTHVAEAGKDSVVKFALETQKLKSTNGVVGTDGNSVIGGKDSGKVNNDALVTAGDVINVMNNTGFTLKTAATAEGSQDGASLDELITAGKKVELTAGKNIKVKQEADGKVTFATEDEVEFTKVKIGNIDIRSTGDTITFNNGGTGPTTITNIKSNLDDTGTGGGATVDFKGPPTLKPTDLSNVATVADVLNAGWNLKENDKNRDFVRAYDTVNFVNGVGTTANVTVTPDGKLANITFNSALGYVNATNAADKSTPTNVVALQGTAAGTPVRMENLASGLVKADGSVATNLADAVGTNAVNVQDLRSSIANNLAASKWNLASSGNAAANEINPDDKVVFEGVGSLNVTHVAEAGKDSVVKFALETQKLKSTNGVVGTDGNSVIGGKDSGKVNNDALVTAGDVINVMNNTGFTLKTAATADGSQDGASLDELITAGKKVELTAGKNIKVKQEADGKVTFATEDEVEFTKVKIGDISIDSAGNKITFGTTTGGPTTITNIKANLDDTSGTGGKPVDFKGPGSLTPADLSNVATVGDVLNAGWNLKENDKNRDFVRAYDTVNFVNGVGTTANVSVNADGTVANVTFNSALAYVNTGAAAADKSTPSNVVALQGPAAGGAVRMENLASGLVKADGSAADVDSAVDTNAVNVKDLRETLNSKLTSSKWNLSSSGNSGVVNDINPDDKVVFEGVGSLNVTHVAEAGKDSVVKFALETQKLTTTNGVVGTDGNSVIGGKDSGKVNNDALVTAGDVINVMNNTGFTLKTAATADGTQDGTSLDELITAGKKVELTAGKNIKVKQEADGKVTFATEDEVEFTKVKIGDISIDSAGNKITFGTTTGGPTTITNIKANLDDTSGTGGKPVDFKGPGSLTPADLSNVATVGDVLNAGWNLKENDQNRDFVRAYDTVNFVNGVGTTANVSVNADGTVANITFNSPLGYVNTGAPTDKSTWTNIVRFEGGAANEAVQVQNVASGVRDSVKAAAAGNPTVKEIADAIAAADATTWNNAVNVRDLQAVANAGKTAIASPKKTIDIGAPVIDPATGATTYNIEVANTALTIADGAGTLPKGKVEAPNADPATGDAHKFVNAGDLATAINNAGFTIYENNGATEKAFVSAGDQVSFNNSTYAIAKVDAENATGRTNISFEIDTAKMFAEQSTVVYTKEDGEVVYKQPDGTFKDKNGVTVPFDQIVTTVKAPDGSTTTPTRLTNLKSTLEPTANTGGAPVTEKTAPTLTDAQQSNAATVGDVLNAGWNLQQNGAAKDFVRAYDTVNFINGIGTRADVSVNADGSVANITFNSALGYVNTDAKDLSNVSNTVKLIGVETGGNMEAVQLTNLASGVRGAVTPANPNKLTAAEIDAIVAAIANATDGTLTNAVNVGDLKAVVESAANKLQQSGWNVGVAAQETANTALTTAGKALVADGATEKVNPNDNVRFADGKNSIVSVATLDQITNDGSKETNTFVRVDVDMPMDYRYTDNTGAEVAKGPDGYFYYVDKATGLPDTKSPRVDATTVSKVGAKLTQGNDAAASYTAATIPALDPAKPTEKDTVHAGTNGVNLGNVAWATEKDQAVNKDQLEQTVNTAGFNVTANGVGSHNTPAKDIEKVTANDAVNFINGTNTQVTAETTRDASGKDTTNIRVDVVGMPMTYTTATGDKVAKAPDGNYYKVGANGLPDTTTPAVSPADIIASMVNPDGDSTTKPTTLANVADGAKVINHATPANKLEEAENGLADLANSNGNNAVNVNDLKNLGWVISTSDETGNTYADDVRHNGKVNFTGDGQFINVKGETKADGTREIKVELKTGEIVKSNEGVGKVGGADVDIIKVGADWYLKGDVDPTTGAPYAGKTPVTLDPNTVVVNKGNGLVTGNQVADAIAQTGFTVGKFDDSKLSQAQKDKLATAFTDPAQNGDEKINPDDQLRYMDTGTTTVGLGTVVDNNPDGSKQTTTIVKVDVNTYGLSVEDGNIAPDARGKVNAPEMTATVGGVDVSVVKVGNDYYAKADINPLTGLPNAGATKVTLDPGTGVKGDGAKLVDAASLASTLNNVGFNVNVGAEGSGVVTSSVPSGELIRAGNSVTFQAGNNLNVKHEANGKVTFATNENVSFTNVHAGNSVVIGDTKAGSATTLTSTARPVDPTDPTKGNQTVLDVGGSVISNVGEGKLEAGSKDLVNGDQVYKGLLAARTEVQAGTNIASVTKELGANGQDIYTVNAEGTTVSVGNDSKYLSVVKGEKDANNVTDYKLDLSDEAKQVIDTAMTEIVTQIDGQDVKTVKKGDNRMNFVSGDNIELTSENGAVKVSTKRDASFDSVRVGDVNIDNNGVSVGDVNISQEGINAGGKRVSNIGDGKEAGDAVNVRQLQGTANALNQKMNRQNREVRAGVAGANAAASLPQVYLPGKSMVAASAGHFKGQSAVAVGYSRASDNGKLILKLQGNANTQGDIGGGVGIGYQW